MIPSQQVQAIHGAIQMRDPLPNGSELPDLFGRSPMLGAALFVVWCSGVGAGDGRRHADRWRFVTVQGANSQKRWMEDAFKESTTMHGVRPYFSAEVIRDLDEYVALAMARGRTVRLCPSLIVHVLEAAYTAQWSAAETSRLLVAIQLRIDEGPRPQTAELEEVVAMIRPGAGAQPPIDKIMRRTRPVATRRP